MLAENELLFLLNETLRRARQKSPYYNRVLSEIPDSLETLKQFVLVPVLTKQLVADHQLELLTSDLFPAHVGISSGTYAGTLPDQLARVYRSDQDALVLQELAHSISPEGESEFPLAIHLINSLHGGSFGPRPPATIELPLEIPFHYQHIYKLLLESHKFARVTQRVTVLMGSLHSLNLLAHLLSKNGNTKSLALRRVFTRAWMLTKANRDFLENVFGCTVTSLFGLSEISGAQFAECQFCGGYRLPPAVYCEFVAPQDLSKPAALGEVAELVLTSLYPLSSLQPYIRYATGDLVQTLTCRAHQELSFKFVGRKAWSPLTEGYVLPSGLLYECADSIADVAREPHVLTRRFDLGALFGTKKVIATLDSNEKLLVKAELNYSPKFYLERAAQVEQLLKKAAVKSIRSLQHASSVKVPMVTVKLFNPGEIDSAELHPH